MRCKNGEV
jgi:alkyl hydroperoxide reductase subunit AhpC